jgi:hypothetical protein
MNPFSVYSWHMVGAGINYFSSSTASRDLDEYKNFDMTNSESQLMSVLNSAAKNTYKHSEYIEYLKQL